MSYIYRITANLDNAAKIVVNAKTQRPSVCNALDTIIVDKMIAADFLPKLIDGFNQFDVEIFADDIAFQVLKNANYTNLQHATEEHFGMEYLSQKCSIKTVENIDEALEHIRTYSSKHSEAIISEDAEKGVRFLNEVDAAAVYTNASTRFTDGGCFGLRCRNWHLYTKVTCTWSICIRKTNYRKMDYSW